jgi:general secretion pathway protein N
MELLRRNPLMAALGLLCIVLAGIVLAEFAMPVSTTSSAAARKVAPAEAKLLPPVMVSSAEQLYPETAARPLWIPTRRPAPAVVAAPASFQKGQFILQGVTIAGATRIALLKEKASGRIHRVEKGRDLNGLQVAEVEPEAVTLVQGGEREVINLVVQRPGGAAPGQPASAPHAGGPFAAAQSPQPGSNPAAPPMPGVPPTAALVPAPPSGSPFGAPLVAPPPGPLPPAATPNPANPSNTAVPQQATTAPMTPEELLARRRARRNATPQ